jgi:hypothetical protein
MAHAAALAVVQYANEDAFYLFNLDGQGQAVTDTWHALIGAALDHAAFEYDGLRWQDVTAPPALPQRPLPARARSHGRGH